MYELTILMPCLNEADTLGRCIEKAQAFLNQENISGEILIADNGSTDGSQSIARALGARVISVVTKGYGATLRSGMEAAKGRFIIMGDADDSYNFLDLKPFLVKLREGYDLVMGNRFKGGISAGAMPALNRYLGNPALSFLGRMFFNCNIGDFHCGLRGFHRERLLQLGLVGDGMEFASEIVIKAVLKELRIAEIPIQLFPDGRKRRPHLRPWRDGWRHLRLLLLFSPNWLFLYPGLALLMFGTSLMFFLTQGPLRLGQINLDIHTLLLSGLFVILGMQAILFAVFAKLILLKGLRLSLKRSRLSSLLKIFTLERGIGTGLLFLMMGLTGAAYGFWYWANHAFGPLMPTQMMRILIPAITALILGAQIIFGSFFLSFINMVDASLNRTQ